MIHLVLMFAALLAQKPSLQRSEMWFSTGHISSLVAEEYTAPGKMTIEEKYFYSVDAAGNESRPFFCTREMKPAARWSCELRHPDGSLMWSFKDGKSTFHNGASRKSVRRRLMFLRLAESGPSAEI